MVGLGLSLVLRSTPQRLAAAAMTAPSARSSRLVPDREPGALSPKPYILKLKH